MLNTAELTPFECPWNTLTEWMGGAQESHNLVVSFIKINMKYNNSAEMLLESYKIQYSYFFNSSGQYDSCIYKVKRAMIRHLFLTELWQYI